MPGFLRIATILAAATTLAACAQSPYRTSHSNQRSSATRQAAIEQPRRPVAVASVVRRAPESGEKAEGKSHGIASFYWQGIKTASGEKFDPGELTAAHPTLPFGTKLRVTNTHTGRSVTVRVNDRGPYVPGRVVDVSRSAAQQLGMIDSGLAPVKLDVVH